MHKIAGGGKECYLIRRRQKNGQQHHIESYHAYYENNADWDNFVLHSGGKEALEADKAQREMLLHEFVPYLKLHNNLSKMDRERKRFQDTNLLKRTES